MKNKIILISLIGIILLIAIRYVLLESVAKQKQQSHQIGTFKLDMHKTDFGSYSSRKYEFDDLTVSFTSKNFQFNNAVPFIWGTKGTWHAAGVEAEKWNNLFFDSWTYTIGMTGEQFSTCCDIDNSFYFNSMTPQKDSASINQIWFTKIDN